jgi:hypothetical protein
VHAADASPVSAVSEQETWAEHRAALDATLFRAGAAIVLELRDGRLEPA